MYILYYMSMRDEKEGGKKQARSNKQTNKQTKQSNTAHPRQSVLVQLLSVVLVFRTPHTATTLTAIEFISCAVLLRFVVCITLLAPFFLPPESLINMYNTATTSTAIEYTL